MSKPPVGITTKINPQTITYCYKNDCGPIIETGFHLEKYQICTKCKQEVSNAIKERCDAKYKPSEAEEIIIDDYEGLFGTGFSI